MRRRWLFVVSSSSMVAVALACGYPHYDFADDGAADASDASDDDDRTNDDASLDGGGDAQDVFAELTANPALLAATTTTLFFTTKGASGVTAKLYGCPLSDCANPTKVAEANDISSLHADDRTVAWIADGMVRIAEWNAGAPSAPVDVANSQGGGNCILLREPEVWWCSNGAIRGCPRVGSCPDGGYSRIIPNASGLDNGGDGTLFFAAGRGGAYRTRTGASGGIATMLTGDRAGVVIVAGDAWAVSLDHKSLRVRRGVVSTTLDNDAGDPVDAGSGTFDILRTDTQRSLVVWTEPAAGSFAIVIRNSAGVERRVPVTSPTTKPLDLVVTNVGLGHDYYWTDSVRRQIHRYRDPQ